MKQQFLFVIFLVCSLLLYTESHAAFPLKAKAARSSNTTNIEPSVQNNTQMIRGYSISPDQAEAAERSSEQKGWGIASLSCAFAGLLTYPLGLLLGVPAIIFGAIGLSRQKRLRGLAIAGLVLGILEVIVLILAILVLAYIFGELI